MKEIIVQFSDEEYEFIDNLVNWKNIRNLLTKKNHKNYVIADFIKGCTLKEVDEIKNIIPSIQYEVSPSTTIRNNFKQLAKERGIKQSDIGRAIGIHKSNLSLIFNNETTIRIDTFFKIWAVLGCPPIHKCISFEG